MTHKLVSKSARIVRQFPLIVCMVANLSISTNAETVTAMDTSSVDGSFVLAQTNGQGRRDTRQDCRQTQGVAGADKRDCKQQGRQK